MAITYDLRKEAIGLGINWLTQEACAFGMRVLCDLNADGVKLFENAFGVKLSDGSPSNYNSVVNGKPAIKSFMITWKQLDELLLYGLAERHCLIGEWLVVANHKENDSRVIWAGTSDEYMEEWAGQVYNTETGQWEESPDADDFRQRWYEWRTYYVYNRQPHVGGRNVHAMTGRVT